MKGRSIDAIISDGVRRTKRRYWSLLGGSLVFGLAMMASALTIIGVLLIPAIYMGFMHFLMVSARDEEASIVSSFSVGFANGMCWKSLFLYTLWIVVGFVGFIFFIVPGLYWVIATFYSFYIMIDKDLDIIESLQASWRLVHSQGLLKLAGAMILMMIVNSILNLFLPWQFSIIALLAYPFYWMIYVALYEDAIGGAEA